MVSDIHRTIVKGQKGSDGKNVSVSETHFVRRRTATHRCVDSDQVRHLGYHWTYYLIFAPVYLANGLPQHQGPVSDATS